MRDLKNLLTLSAIIIFCAWFAKNNNQLPDLAYYSLLIILPIFYLFRVLLSRRVKYKHLITNKLNFLGSKKKTQIEIGLDVSTAYNFLLELPTITDNIKFLDCDSRNRRLLFLTKPNWLTWGSNVYISLKELNANQTELTIEIVAFQLYNWGENDRIMEEIISSIDHKLTI